MPSTETRQKKDDRAMTYQQLLEQLQRLTPEQLSMRVVFSGEDKWGFIWFVNILDNDMVSPSGGRWETRSEFMRFMIQDEGATQEEAEAEPVVAHKGQPVLEVVE